MQNKNNEGTKNGSQDSKSKKAIQDDFDSRVKALLTQADITPPQGLFEQIEQKRHVPVTFWQRIQKQRRFVYGFPAAAVVVLAILGVVFWKFYASTPSVNHPVQGNAGSVVAISPAASDAGQRPVPDPAVAKKEVQEIAVAKPTKPHDAMRRNDNKIAIAKEQVPKRQRNPALAQGRTPQTIKGNGSWPSGSGASAQSQAVVSDQNRIVRVEPNATNHAVTVAVQAKEEPVVASLSNETSAARSKAVAALQVPDIDIAQKAHKTVDKAMASAVVEGASSTDNALSGGTDDIEADQAVAARPRKKKGFLKGIFAHVKERVDEISESVVDEQPGKTTYNLGFVAVTAYK